MNQNPIILPDFGRVPPQAIDCEQAVLGMILLYKEAITEVIPILRPEMFYKEAHRKIYLTAENIYKHEKPVDFLTVTEELRNTHELDSVGGPVYLTKLTSTIYSDSQLEYYCLIIKDKYIRRELIRHSAELQAKAFDETIDLADIVDSSENDLLQITDHTHKKEPVKLGKLVDWLIDKIQKIINHEIKLIGIPSGFTVIDRKTGGFKNGELIIIAGRPSMGKSAVALQIAINNAEMGFPVGLFSCEMSGESLAQRSLSAVSGKSNVELMEGRCEIENLLSASEKLITLPVFIDDTSGISVIELRSKARKLMLKHNIRLLIVDYLQLMKAEGQSREQEVSNISRGLKSIAKDLEIPVIALSQINRKSEDRGEKRPQLSDLRESGAIEQDADMVAFVYRPAYYGIREVDTTDGRKDTEGLMELILAKNRNGMTGSFFLKHNTALTKIFEENETPEPSSVDSTIRF